jgi:hypothetical protein
VCIPDPIELMESRIDTLIVEQCDGVPEGYIKCYGCKKIVPINETVAASARPDAPAICGDCCES